MKKILIVSGHPDLSHSSANRLILEKLISLPGVTICDVRTNYPDGQIDVEAERAALKEADLVVLQFPFIWYGMPSHFKAWMEAVFSEGFAYGKDGGALKNKYVLLSVTLGGNTVSYSAEGQHRYPVETFLRPLQMFLSYCGMKYLPPVYSYAMSSHPGAEDTLEEKATLHAQRVMNTLDMFKPEHPLLQELKV